MRKPELIAALHECLLEESRGKDVAVITHWGGDADSIGAAYVLKNLLKEEYNASRVSFTIPDTATAHSKAILSRLGMELEYVGDSSLFILVDVGSLEQLGELFHVVMDSEKKPILIDHHLHSDYGESRVRQFCSDEYQATAEIILDLALHAGRKLTREDAEALFLGMYYDTARLSIADEETMRKVCKLASMGVKPADVLVGLEMVMDESERIARLKAARRMSFYRIAEWLVAISTVSAFQTSAARALISLGAHVALVAGQEDDETVLSLRAQPEFVRRTAISMGEALTSKIREKYGGTGGGHASVARVRCRAGAEEVLEYALKLLETKLGAKAQQVS